MPIRLRNALHNTKTTKTIRNVSFGANESYCVTYTDGSVDHDLSGTRTVRDAVRKLEKDQLGFLRHVHMTCGDADGDDNECFLIQYADKVM